jgi:hypothetical protein
VHAKGMGSTARAADNVVKQLHWASGEKLCRLLPSSRQCQACTKMQLSVVAGALQVEKWGACGGWSTYGLNATDPTLCCPDGALPCWTCTGPYLLVRLDALALHNQPPRMRLADLCAQAPSAGSTLSGERGSALGKRGALTLDICKIWRAQKQ